MFPKSKMKNIANNKKLDTFLGHLTNNSIFIKSTKSKDSKRSVGANKALLKSVGAVAPTVPMLTRHMY